MSRAKKALAKVDPRYRLAGATIELHGTVRVTPATWLELKRMGDPVEAAGALLDDLCKGPR